MSPEKALQRKLGHTYHNIPSGLVSPDHVFVIDKHQRRSCTTTWLEYENGLATARLYSLQHSTLHNTTIRERGIRATMGDVRRLWGWQRWWSRTLQPRVDGLSTGGCRSLTMTSGGQSFINSKKQQYFICVLVYEAANPFPLRSGI